MEKNLEQFLQAWKIGNWDKMYSLCQITWKSNHSKSELKNLLNGKIKSFNIVSNNFDISLPCIVDYFVKVKVNGKVKELSARLLKEKAKMKPDIDGIWGVNPISIIRNLYM